MYLACSYLIWALFNCQIRAFNSISDIVGCPEFLDSVGRCDEGLVGNSLKVCMDDSWSLNNIH